MNVWWGILWRQDNLLDGRREYLFGGKDCLFRTRAEARAYIAERFGYIRERSDLRAEPHGWRMPQAVRVKIERC